MVGTLPRVQTVLTLLGVAPVLLPVVLFFGVHSPGILARLHFFDILPVDAHSLGQLTFRLGENLALLSKSLVIRKKHGARTKQVGAEGESLMEKQRKHREDENFSLSRLLKNALRVSLD